MEQNPSPKEQEVPVQAAENPNEEPIAKDPPKEEEKGEPAPPEKADVAPSNPEDSPTKRPPDAADDPAKPEESPSKPSSEIPDYPNLAEKSPSKPPEELGESQAPKGEEVETENKPEKPESSDPAPEESAKKVEEEKKASEEEPAPMPNNSAMAESQEVREEEPQGGDPMEGQEAEEEPKSPPKKLTYEEKRQKERELKEEKLKKKEEEHNKHCDEVKQAVSDQKAIVKVFLCQNCEEHQWCTRHDPAKYEGAFNKLKGEIEEKYQDKIFVAKNFEPKEAIMLGEFKVEFNNKCLFSKRDTGRWPKKGEVISVLDKEMNKGAEKQTHNHRKEKNQEGSIVGGGDEQDEQWGKDQEQQ